ncbi:hypothetical protein BH23VER1_BH23VER1_20530 [soil metagenome]
MADEDAPTPPAPKPPTPAAPPRPPAKPTAKTSSVPLKKETVRITLRAKPGEGTEGGDSSAPARHAPPSAPGVPSPPAGSKTIPLTPPGAARPGAPQVGKTTARLSTAPASAPLPKATQQLRRTGPVSSAPPTGALGGASASLQTGAFEEEDDEPAGLLPLSIAAAVLGFILLIVMMAGSDKVDFMVKKGGTPSWGVPEGTNPTWEVPQPTGEFRSTFDNRLPTIPE